MQARNKMALSSESVKQLQKTTVSWFEFLFDTSGNALKKHLESAFAGLRFIIYSRRKIAEWFSTRFPGFNYPRSTGHKLDLFLDRPAFKAIFLSNPIISPFFNLLCLIRVKSLFLWHNDKLECVTALPTEYSRLNVNQKLCSSYNQFSTKDTFS